MPNSHSLSDGFHFASCGTDAGLSFSSLTIVELSIFAFVKQLIFEQKRFNFSTEPLLLLNYFFECKPIALPSISIKIVTKPNGPIDILGLMIFPPALIAFSASAKQSSESK